MVVYQKQKNEETIIVNQTSKVAWCYPGINNF